MKERELENRTETLKYLEPEVFDSLEFTARSELKMIIEVMDGTFTPREGDVDQLLRKWCLNLLVFLILRGGGQRPQVYACVKCPAMTNLLTMENQSKETGFFTLITGTEKRPRPSNAPKFTLPAICFKYIEYHVLHVRPFLIARRDVREPIDRECLLLDTRTAISLDSRYITKSLKTFVKAKDPELAKNLTTMHVRSSFATNKLMEFKEAERDGKTTQTLESYMESLAALMNTSTTMLKDIYVAIDDSDFLAAAVNVYKYVRRESNDE